ncbi:hypothetical protein BT96DRAFT_378743 [Gymnopus androsaceus JB14]|uniref:DUF6534 domain-containing protein n=1 Tax=Gymnopus androsaceus JB14 TaxID=1447944 RepID=A0A6A4IQP0_9AGAR|nr:hypothetical protein BT96DRAFT_378743 [Gymnopus androsaceus JB14]
MTASLLDLTVGALVVGSFLSILTCGIVLCAAWRYYAVYTKDRLAFKLVVTVVLLLSIANTVSDAYWCYNWTVTNYAVPAVLYLMPVSLLVDTFCVGTCALVVQTFFSWRIWKISQERNWLLPVCVTVLSFTQFGIILWVISYWAQHKLLTDIGGVLPIGYIWLSSSLVADFSITCGIVYYLGIKPSIALPSGAKMTFTHIITRTIQANVFSLLPQVLTFALFKVPNIGLYFFLIDFAICKAYAFSVIVSLNTRRVPRLCSQVQAYHRDQLVPVSRCGLCLFLAEIPTLEMLGIVLSLLISGGRILGGRILGTQMIWNARCTLKVRTQDREFGCKLHEGRKIGDG